MKKMAYEEGYNDALKRVLHLLETGIKRDLLYANVVDMLRGKP